MANQAGAPHSQISPWIVAITVMSSTFMEILDTTVVNVSLPHIAGNLSATVDESTWVLTSYLVANAIILPLTGWLANYFGRKRFLMAAVAGFTGASFLCGLAPNLQMLIFFRLLQGASGGALQPLSQAILLEAFPPQDRGKAMGFWGLGVVTAPILGPVLGGWLTDNYSWRWVFYINLPVGLLSILMTRLFIFDPAYIRRSSARIDYWGIGLLAVWIGTLQVILDKGQEEDWFASNFITTLSLISAVAFILFLIYEIRVRIPVVNLRIFKVRTYSAGVFLMTMLGFVLYGSLVLLPLFLQTLLGYPSLQAGIAMAPRGFGSFLAMPIIGIITSKFDPRKLLGIGLVTGSGTLFWLSRLNLNAGYWDIFWPQFIQGISFGLLFVPLTTITMDPIPKEQIGNAASIFNLMRNLGGSIGIAAATTILARREQMYINLLGGHVNPYNPQSQMMMQEIQGRIASNGSDLFTAERQALGVLFNMVQRQASMLSFNEMFSLMAIIFLAVIPFLLLMRRPKAPRGAVAAH